MKALIPHEASGEEGAGRHSGQERRWWLGQSLAIRASANDTAGKSEE